MARPTEEFAKERIEVTDQIAIGLRAFDEARRCQNIAAKAHLFDFAISHITTAAQKIATQKRIACNG